MAPGSLAGLVTIYEGVISFWTLGGVARASILAVFDAASLRGPPGTTVVARPVAPATRSRRL